MANTVILTTCEEFRQLGINVAHSIHWYESQNIFGSFIDLYVKDHGEDAEKIAEFVAAFDSGFNSVNK